MCLQLLWNGSVDLGVGSAGWIAAQIKGREIFVAISRFFLPSQAGVLVDATTFLFGAGEVLADACPELAAAAAGSAAEEHLIRESWLTVDFHLAELATETGAGWNGHRGVLRCSAR
jgi:hypothetical protein